MDPKQPWPAGGTFYKEGAPGMVHGIDHGRALAEDKVTESNRRSDLANSLSRLNFVCV